jgi:Flp pilus assembly secretin CpaC
MTGGRTAVFLTLAVTAAAGLLAADAVTAPARAADPIVVTMDRAKVMRIPAPAATVIVGNPAIADVSIHDRQTLVLTGRMAGSTNLVVLDKKGDPIAEEVVTVEVAESGIIFVQRGASRYSYACTPNCAVTMRTGDNRDHFNDAKAQIDAVNQNATAFSGAAQ